jgi:hypothetical protein
VKVYFFIVVCLLVATTFGCRTQRESLQSERVVEVRTEIVETLRDTTIYISADSSVLIAYLKCDSVNNVLLKQVKTIQGKRSKIDYETQTNIDGSVTLTADCVCDSLEIYFQIKDRYEKDFEKVTDTEIIERIVEVKQKCKVFQNVLIGFLIGILVSIIVQLIIKIYLKK